ncbi:hypothetical protein ES703_122405 [subsurface metagenome]
MSLLIKNVKASRIPHGLHANRPTYPKVGDVYLCDDTGCLCSCKEAGVWIEVELT